MNCDPDIAAMLRLREGQDTALNEIMERWQRPLTSFLYRQLGNEQEALDLAQETFVRVFENRHRYKPAGKFSTWLFTIANNLCRNFFRWRSRHPTIALEGEDGAPLDITPDTAETPVDSAESSELAAAVRSHIQRLPEHLRTALLLSEYEEMSYQDIAAVVGCSAKAVETRIYRAKALLRESFLKTAVV